MARAEVEATLEAAADRRGPGPWVWIYHSPPEGPLAWTGSRHYGDEAVSRWIERFEPDVVLCGHIHQAPFAPGGSWADRVGRTWLFNPGRQMGGVPAFVDIDLTEGTAVWMSSMGIEERALGLAGTASTTGTAPDQ